MTRAFDVGGTLKHDNGLMISEILNDSRGFTWLDILDPTPGEIKEIASKYKLPAHSIEDCLDAEHLPKFERIQDLNFMILRAFDEKALPEADTVQELTRKVALFYTSTFLLTVHRKDQDYFAAFRERWKANRDFQPSQLPTLIADLVDRTIDTFDKPIDEALNQLEQLEMSVFGAEGSKPFKIRKAYYLKRKAAVFKRMLRMTMDFIPRLGNDAALALSGSELQNLREVTDSSLYYCDEITDSLTSLLSLHISLASQKTNEASHRTNEVMRLLTIFSVFLLPLNVLTGIYGMNFEHMPELKAHYGYPIVLGSMLLVSTSIYFWFRKKGWLK